MKQNVLETMVGAIILLITVIFFVFAYNNSGQKTDSSSVYYATFDRVDGISIGSDVRMSGVKVGSVQSIAIESNTYLANIKFALDNKIQLPKDSSAEVVSDGLLGSKYLAIVPGGDENILQAGETITHTQSSVNLESLIGRLIFSGKKD